VAKVIYGRVQAVGPGGDWVARAVYVRNEERHLVPIGMEVRPAAFAPSYESQPWDPLPQEVDDSLLPPGGLSLSLLRSDLEWEDRDSSVERVIEAELGELYAFGLDTLIEHLRTVTDIAVERGMLRRGRRDLARSLFVLIESSAEAARDGRPPTRDQIISSVRRVYPDFDEAELRSTIQWARTQKPPLFLPYGQRQRGGRISRATLLILVLTEPLDSLEPDFRDSIRRERAAELPEFS
jgi:hypothetical protein